MAAFLLIDQDRNFREALAIALRLDGCEVSSTNSVGAGRAAVRSGAYDLCVVDLHLPGAEALLAEVAGGPAPVVITGPHEDLLEQAARRHPGVKVLAKPFGAPELLRRLA